MDEILNETIEFYPELLFPVNMLFIDGKINQHKCYIFIDTGA